MPRVLLAPSDGTVSAMTNEDLAKLELLVRDANEAVAAGRKADSIRDELAFSVPKLIAEIRALRITERTIEECLQSLGIPLNAGVYEAIRALAARAR